MRGGPTGHVCNQRGDGALGLNTRICRRDFLNAALLASGSTLLSSLTPNQLLGQQPLWGGYSGVGDYAGANGNTEDVMLWGPCRARRGLPDFRINSSRHG
jgi:hypothetical protein